MPSIHPDRPIKNDESFRARYQQLGIRPDDDPIYRQITELYDLIKNDTDSTGRSINISGTHGTGKSSFANILSSKLQDGNLVVQARTMFYGNFDEYIEGVLGDVYADFADRFGVKLKELKKLSSNIAVTLEAGFDLFGIVNIKFNGVRSFSLSGTQSNDSLVLEDSSLNKKLGAIFPQRVIIVIDDLDRLQPNELMIALRLIEVLRQLKNVIVIAVGDIARMGDILQVKDIPEPRQFPRKVFDERVHLRRNLRDLEKIVLLMVEGVLSDKAGRNLGDHEKSIIIEASHFLILRQIIQNIRSIPKELIDRQNIGPSISHVWEIILAADHEKLGSIYDGIRGYFSPKERSTRNRKERHPHRIWTVEGLNLTPAIWWEDGMALMTERPVSLQPHEINHILRGMLPASYWAQQIIPSPDDIDKVIKYQFNDKYGDIDAMFAELDQGGHLPIEMIGDQKPESRWSIVRKFMSDSGQKAMENDSTLTQFNDLRSLRHFAAHLAELLPTLLTLTDDESEQKRLDLFVDCVEYFENPIRVEKGDL